MSLTDPTADRSKVATRRGSLRGFAIARCAVWIAFGYSLANVAVFPVASVYLRQSEWPPNVAPPLLWLLFVSLFLGIVSGISGRAAGSATRAGMLIASVSLGFAAGAFVFWPNPVAIGLFGPGDPWGIGPWIAWAARYWAPIVGVALAVLVWVVSARIRRRIETVDAVRVEAMAQGVSVSGVVTETEDTGISIGNRPIVRFTVKFADRQGRARWVQREAAFDSTQVPRAGDAAMVWFLPQRIDDAESMAVRLDAIGEVF